MDELIQKLTSQLGIDPAVAASATGKAMAMVKDQLGGFASTVVAFLKEKLGDDVVQQVLGKVPALKGLLG